MTEKGEPMLLMGLLTPAEVMGGREVMEAAEGTNGGERWPDGGEDTDELSGLRESLLSPMMVAGAEGPTGSSTPRSPACRPAGRTLDRGLRPGPELFWETKNGSGIPTQGETK